MNTHLRRILVVVAIISGSLLFEKNAFADGNDFSIAPVLPENQRAGVESYFDLSVEPNQKQALKIVLKNNDVKDQKYKIYVNTATTNQNGIIDYSDGEIEKDESMATSLKDCVKLPVPQIEVPAHGEKEVSFEVNIPPNSFKGVLLGGITVEPVNEEKKEGISNLLTRTLAIQLSESEETVNPELKAGEVKISQENYRNNVKAELRNVSPVIISKVKADISITKKGQKEPILEQKREQLSFAPNSKFDLMTEWNEQFESGEYTYAIHLSDEMGHQWSFKKDFEIADKQAKTFNDKSVDKTVYHIQDYLPYIVGLLFILFGCTLYFFK